MTRKIILLFLILLAGKHAAAQKEDIKHAEKGHSEFKCHELTLGHGLLPTDQMFARLISGYDYDNSIASGAISLTYRYRFSKFMSVGVVAAYEHERGTWGDDPGFLVAAIFGGGYTAYGDFSRNCFTIAPEMTLDYGDVAEGRLRFYVVCGVGLTLVQQEMTVRNYSSSKYYSGPVPGVDRMHFNMQFTPFGMRFGKALGGFVELGLGYKGLFCYGISYKFQ